MTANILIVDDEQMLRLSISAYLEDSGYQVNEACSGVEALEVLAEKAVDLMVCDLRMPQMEGLELIRRARQRYKKLPIIIVSGAGVMDDVVQALRLGANDYIVKPILDMMVLEHSIVKNLELARLEQENQAYKDSLEQMNQELKHGLNELHLDQQAGRHIQKKMLPEPSQFQYQDSPVLDFQHYIKPSLYLSGDFLDYFPLDEEERYIAFYIADVSGHGSSSAFVTVLLKNLTYRLRRNLKRGSSDDLFHPNKVLARLNQELKETGIEKHLTIFYAVFDTQQSELNYSVGAHFPMPVLLQDGIARFLDGEGMPIGIFEYSDYQNYSIKLSQTFSLVLFSDGILEVLEEKSLAAKEQKILEVIQQDFTCVDQLKDAFQLQQTSEVPDDIAIMTLTRK